MQKGEQSFSLSESWLWELSSMCERECSEIEKTSKSSLQGIIDNAKVYIAIMNVNILTLQIYI